MMALQITEYGEYGDKNGDDHSNIWNTDTNLNNNVQPPPVVDSYGRILVSEAPQNKKVDPFVEKAIGEQNENGPPGNDKVSWSEFTENTTFHGIRYIFNSSFKLRRVLWVVCVLAAVAYFAWQVGQRTSDYFKYATNVDVKVVYTERLRFPAVTLCNQNNFRTTEMVDNSLYFFIDDIYSATNMTGVNFTAYDVTNISSHDFITSSSHQLHDLIDQCTWNQRPCDLDNDFVRTITDVGVCYTFNSGQKQATRFVEEYGNQYGLKLILNVEQYEYMKGPNNDAGVKILLHDQKEQPLMRDMGFAVEPGTHTLVAIHMSEVRSMAPPYGNCDPEMERGSRSHCLLDCQRAELADRCQCYDVYMQNGSLPTCDLRTLFECARDTSQNQALSGKGCKCGVPCTAIKYEPTFSYAQLSQFNMERMVLVDPERRDLVEDTFALALEYSQRVDPEIVENDQEQLTELIQFVDELEEIINETYIGLSSETNFQNTYSIPLPIINGDEMFTRERTPITDIRNERDMFIEGKVYYEMDYDPYYSYVHQYQPVLPNVAKSLGGIWYDVLTLYNSTLYLGERLLSRDEDLPDTNQPVETTTSAQTEMTTTALDSYSEFSYYTNYYNYHSDYSSYDYRYYNNYNSYNYYRYNHWGMSSYSVTECYLDMCFGMLTSDIIATFQSIFDTAKEKATSLISELRVAIENDNNTIINFANYYQETIDYLYNGTFTTYEDIPEHLECQENLNEIQDVLEKMPDVLISLEHFAQSDTKEEMITRADQLYQILNDSLIQKYAKMDATIKGSCVWMVDYSGYNWDGQCYHDEYSNDYDCDKVTTYFSNLESMRRAYELFGIGFIGLGRYISNMHTTMKARIGPVLKSTILEYLDANITKMELASVMESLLGRKSLEDIVGDGTDFVSTALESMRESELIKENLKEAYRSILTTVVPIYNTSDFKATRFIEFVISHNKSETNALLDSLETNVTATMEQLLEYIFGSYFDIVNEVRDELSSSLDNLADAAETLDEDLEEYIQLGRMNEDFYMNNFLQVDLFYKELNYEEIEQQPTFGFPSLLSEVGGFLGLLLGASILTVCELLDYMTMAVYTRIRRNKEIRPQNQQKVVPP